LVDIALTLNFSSQANFHRAFRGATGVTPGAFRSKRRERQSAEASARAGAGRSGPLILA
jgi:AraC-like DNA-binding protein